MSDPLSSTSSHNSRLVFSIYSSVSSYFRPVAVPDEYAIYGPLIRLRKTAPLGSSVLPGNCVSEKPESVASISDKIWTFVLLMFCWPCIVFFQPVHQTATYRCEDTRGRIIQFWPPDDDNNDNNNIKFQGLSSTTHLKLAPMRRLCGSARLLPLYVFTSWTGNFTFHNLKIVFLLPCSHCQLSQEKLQTWNSECRKTQFQETFQSSGKLFIRADGIQLKCL